MKRAESFYFGFLLFAFVTGINNTCRAVCPS